MATSPVRARLRATRHSVHAVLALLATALLIGALPSPAAADVDQQALIVDIAYSKLGSKFLLGASGPNKFDCSGFVWYVFNTADLADVIGGKPRRARGFQKWFRERGLLTRDNPRVGDLVFYGNPAVHTGIVTRIDIKGRARVTSALTSGVAETLYNRLNVPFNGFGHTNLGVIVDPPPPTPPPTPEPTPAG